MRVCTKHPHPPNFADARFSATHTQASGRPDRQGRRSLLGAGRGRQPYFFNNPASETDLKGKRNWEVTEEFRYERPINR
jgi:hypothetical protein